MIDRIYSEGFGVISSAASASIKLAETEIKLTKQEKREADKKAGMLARRADQLEKQIEKAKAA